MMTTPCKDCGVDTCPLGHDGRAEYYMVHNCLWKQAGMTKGILCIGCIEARLGRQLTRADFTTVPVNDLGITDDVYAWSWRTPRMVDRLSA